MLKSVHHISYFQNFPSKFVSFFFILQNFKYEISLHPKKNINTVIICYNSSEFKWKFRRQILESEFTVALFNMVFIVSVLELTYL